MEFEAPTAADYDNVRALNYAFLGILQDKSAGSRYLGGLPATLARRLQQLNRAEMHWLAATPFLLLSFREREPEFWRKLLATDQDRDILSIRFNSMDDVDLLVSAGLGFIWHLANRNSFAARLLCGATTHWCEQVSEHTIYYLIAVAGNTHDVLTLRSQDDIDLWKKLLVDGLSFETEIRMAARMSALQHMLTRQPVPKTWSAAACSSQHPSLKVAEEPKR